MTKAELHLLQSSLFAPPLIEHEKYVIEPVASSNIDQFHECLLQCPRPLSHLMKSMGIKLKTIADYRIGYVDTAKFEAQIMMNSNAHKFQSFRRCFTLPLFKDSQMAGVYGLRYESGDASYSEKICLCYADMPIYSPFPLKSTAILCDNPFQVLALCEMGYCNGVAILGEGITSMSLAALADLDIQSLVIFSHADSEPVELSDSKALAKQYGITICEVQLPFRLTGFGNWDSYQWQIFDKRLGRTLKMTGGYNERYQA